ncbi:MAG: prepilin-type N-terminal cleavage/methylation domain-containing protein [Candidatus Staskawiczbacteria bacterium]|jgi:prepilin-type N-terminal cleavage/methylation domain-containing protein
MQKSKGFTIIELIVVIAIIAVLAGIVLVNVTQYINKSKDAAIKANLRQIYTVAAEKFLKDYTYIGFVISNPSGQCAGSSYQIHTSVSAFAAYAKLCTSSAFWCVDSTGAVKELATAPDSDVYTCTAGDGGAGGGETLCGGITCEPGYICIDGACAYVHQCPGGHTCETNLPCCGSGCCTNPGDSCCDGITCYNPEAHFCCGQGNGVTSPNGGECPNL